MSNVLKLRRIYEELSLEDALNSTKFEPGDMLMVIHDGPAIYIAISKDNCLPDGIMLNRLSCAVTKLENSAISTEKSVVGFTRLLKAGYAYDFFFFNRLTALVDLEPGWILRPLVSGIASKEETFNDILLKEYGHGDLIYCKTNCSFYMAVDKDYLSSVQNRFRNWRIEHVLTDSTMVMLGTPIRLMGHTSLMRVEIDAFSASNKFITEYIRPNNWTRFKQGVNRLLGRPNPSDIYTDPFDENQGITNE